ncbi:MAG: hypothetical protein Kow0056_14860 [Coriobacteriia bacterium]
MSSQADHNGMDDARTTADEVDRIVVFSLGGQKYALPIQVVQEIQQIVEPTGVPDTVPALLGMIDLRGEILPLFDLRRLLGVEAAPIDLQTPMIITRSRSRQVALLVDEVDDVVETPPGSVKQAGAAYEIADKLIGVCRLGEGLVLLLDIDSLLPEERIAAVGDATGGSA